MCDNAELIPSYDTDAPSDRAHCSGKISTLLWTLTCQDNIGSCVACNHSAWVDGPPTSEITSIAKFWVEEYDWDAVQSRFNAGFDHYTITVPPPGGNYTEELDLHFIHQQSSRDDATPLLMLHEWPSTSLEWEKVIPGLANPGKYQPAFHVVAPDLPGFGFLPAPTEPGLGPQELAHVFPSLMQQLGYKRYAVYSTDLGFPVALFMVQNNAVEIINHIDDFYVVFPNADDLAAFAANQSTAEEVAIIAAVNDFNTNHAAYSAIHSTLPLSIAHSLNDSPVGFLAWIYQLVYTVSDKAYTTSELITQALLLYIPGVYGNIRSYEELCPVLGLLANGAIPKSAVPTSVLQFGGKTPYPPLDNFNFIPREWVERTANVTYFSRHPTGGHFPAWSEPELVLEGIRAIFS